VTQDRVAAELVRAAKAVLVDFDGPICRLFANVQAERVAADLSRLLSDRGVAIADQSRIDDPLEVLRMSTRVGPEIARAVHAELEQAEVRAASTSVPSPDAEMVLRELARKHRIAVVSNNSAAAVRTYLELHDLADVVPVVSARSVGDVAQMKPNPFLLSAALTALDVTAERAVFVGDSVTDVEAATAARVPCVGYANKPGKAERLAGAGAVALVYSMSELL
jgi:HAD superfamily hydrolase (TIGR01509 family)